ncbi:MAG TPA: putative sulfate/molybdate transporter [Gaiellaceae bacterium]|nr:putative sulfate/molybdate transporter [Gaiellaceae bacterium]
MRLRTPLAGRGRRRPTWPPHERLSGLPAEPPPSLRRELSGAVADVGVLVPIAVALIVTNGLSPTAVLLPAGILYVTVAFLYRLPVAVQPLKALGAIAIAKGLGADEIAAAALLMGVIFVGLGATGLVDRAARAFPQPLIRGVQLTVGLLFLKVAWGLVEHPPHSFAAHALPPAWAVPLGAVVVVLALLLRRWPVALALVVVGAGVSLALAGGAAELGPSPLVLPSLSAATLGTALMVLVVPQLPLTFANSCLAPADAARTYFGTRAQRLSPGRLAVSLGSANLVAGGIAGMPVCHGAGGMTAHYAFGARTGRAPLAIGVALLAVALLAGSGLAALLAAFPLPILAGLLATAGLLHIGLLGDLRGWKAWAATLLVGGVGFTANLAWGLAAGLLFWWTPVLAGRVGSRSWSSRLGHRFERPSDAP